MKKTFSVSLLVLLCLIVAISLAKACLPNTADVTGKRQTTRMARRVRNVKRKKAVSASEARPYPDPDDLRKEGSWQKSSEKRQYPHLGNRKNLILRVSLKGNRVYVIRKGRIVYTMMCTAGLFEHGKSDTPTGTFHIQKNRGANFFNGKLNEGAHNWTSWDPKNVYLFHSVPTKADGQINITEAKKLGRTQGSHGCIRLSLPDSKWVMEKMPAGTEVIVENE